MRQLVSIRRVDDVQPIEGADAIEVVVVGGWNVVSGKGNFQPGDLCVYAEIDSVLPVRDEFEFLRDRCFVKKDWLASESNPTGEGFRLRSIKLRGVVSQGLVIPVSELFPDDVPAVGTDVTEILGVVKWDPPVPASLAGKVRGNFPSYIPKTDQERIQNLADKLDELRTHVYEVTLKLDGTSMTVFHRDGEIGVCSRNLLLDIENDRETTYAKLFYKLGLDEILPELGNYAIQGECMGPGIQGNRENLKEHTFFVFDIYNIDEARYLSSYERVALINDLREAGCQIEHAPLLRIGIAEIELVAELLAEADGPSINHPIREGLVYKSVYDPSVSFKVISNKFLLKSES